MSKFLRKMMSRVAILAALMVVAVGPESAMAAEVPDATNDVSTNNSNNIDAFGSRGQTFTVLNSGNLIRVELPRISGRFCAPDEDLRLQIVDVNAADRTFGAVLAEFIFPATLVSSWPTETDLVATLPTPVPVEAGERLAIVLSTDSTCAYHWPVAVSDPDGSYPDGQFFLVSGNHWSPLLNQDVLFRTFVETTDEPPTPEVLLEDLVAAVETINTESGIANNSLEGKLNAVKNALTDANENNDVAAFNALEAFIKTTENQAAQGKISQENAAELIALAREIQALL